MHPLNKNMYHYIFQVANIIFRRVLAMLDFKQIQRHYYSPQQAKEVVGLGMEVWPGFETAIRQFQTKTMMLVDLSHKIVRTDTVYDKMCHVAHNNRNWKDILTSEIVGKVVITGWELLKFEYEKNANRMLRVCIWCMIMNYKLFL